MVSRKILFVSPGRTLIGALLCIIGIGTFLLSLPISQVETHTFIDLLFTSTSACCVTGLLTTSIHSFTFFGKSIILLLIQIGGLGLITLTVFFISLFFNVGIKTHLMAGQLLELESWKNTRSILGFIITLTMSMEILGSLMLYWTIDQPHGFVRAFNALFHAVSSFCSAGFEIFSYPFSQFATNIPFLCISGILIVIGELGFITWSELFKNASYTIKNKKPLRLSLHSKIVIIFTIGIILTTSFCLFLLEYAHNPTLTGALNSTFNAIAYRSSGFTTKSIGALQNASLFIIMLVAFIGSSPGSTGSGIKITTFALLLATVRAVITGKSVVEMKGRQIPNDQIIKAFAVFTLSIACIGATTFALLITERWSFLESLFEACAAFSNLGLSIRNSTHLSTLGKIIIMIAMILGRIGSLTLILAIKKKKKAALFHYPEERIMLS